MNALQFQAFLPFIVLASASIVVILLIAFRAKPYGDTGNRFYNDVHGGFCYVVCERYFAKSNNAIVYCGWIGEHCLRV